MRRNGLLESVPEPKPMKKGGKNAEDPTEMWTERYKPQTLYDLIGNTAVVD